jgi:nucleoid DNA-binding protein
MYANPDWIDFLAVSAGISRRKATKVLDEMCHEIRRKLADGKRVRLPGVGILEVHAVSSNAVRNPRTGAPAAQCHRGSFRALEGLKRAVREVAA